MIWRWILVIFEVKKKVVCFQYILYHEVCPLIWSYLELRNSGWDGTNGKWKLKKDLATWKIVARFPLNFGMIRWRFLPIIKGKICWIFRDMRFFRTIWRVGGLEFSLHWRPFSISKFMFFSSNLLLWIILLWVDNFSYIKPFEMNLFWSIWTM